MDNVELELIASELQALGTAPNTVTAPLLLALDQGGHASRALVFDQYGRQITQAFAPITTLRSTTAAGITHIEHDPTEVIASLRTVINDVAQTLGTDVNRLVAAGLATQRSSIVCWDVQTGQTLTPILSWQDRRNDRLVQSLRPQRERIQRITGLVLSPHYGASKMRWCLENVPAIQQAHAIQRLCMGPLASYILYALLNEHPVVVDPSNASRTQLWDLTTYNWSTELLELFQLPATTLPHCVPTHSVYGTLTVGTHTIPLHVCTGDQAAAPFAGGELQRNTVYLNLGTGGFLLIPHVQDIRNAAPYLRSVLWSNDTQVMYALEGTVNGAGSALDWLAEHNKIDAHRLAHTLQRTQVTALHPPLFINGVSGIGSPYWLPAVNSHFVGDGTETEQLIAVIESIAFLIVVNLNGLQTLSPQLKLVHAGGGLAIDYLCECIADLSGLTITRSSERELTAKGLAFLIAKQPDEWLNETHTTSFLPTDNPALCQRFMRWQASMETLTVSG